MTTRKIVKAVYVSYWRQKRGKRPTGATCEGVDDVSNDETADDADDSSERDGSSWLTERDTTYEDNGFHTFTEDGDHRQDEQSPLSSLGTAVNIYRTNGSTQLG